MKPICVPCQRFYRMTTIGYYFIEGMPKGGETEEARRPPAGNERPDLWTPYKLWSGDLWRCEGCGHQVIHGTSRNPIAEHYEPSFAEHVATLGADQFQVNDC